MTDKINLAELVRETENNTTLWLEPGEYYMDKTIDLAEGKSIDCKEPGTVTIHMSQDVSRTYFDSIRMPLFFTSKEGKEESFVNNCIFKFIDIKECI